MLAPDPFTEYYSQFLDSSYDVLDRIVLNAHFILAQSPGGFRTWWRQLHDGRDDNLDNTHLMRLAGRFSRRVRGWAKKNNIPVIDSKAGNRKCDVAKDYLPEDPSFRGIFAVIVGRAPAPTWDAQRSKSGRLDLRRKKPMTWVSHYHFHIIDEHWGHVTIKLCGHPPFSAQIMLNGHEYVASRARRMGVVFTKEENCFTDVSSAAELAEVADTLRSTAAVGQLRLVCERWIYRCVAFGLSFDEQKKTNFRYSYSIFQLECSRNLLFTRGAVMDQVFNGVIDRTRSLLNIDRVKTLFGYKHRPKSRRNNKLRFQVAVETPVYDLTVFKVHFGRQTLKIYTKGERVLRFEAITHSAKDLRCGIVLDRFPVIVERLSQMLERFLEVLRCVDTGALADDTLDTLPEPSTLGRTRVAGIDLNKKRVRAVLEAIVMLAPNPCGFTAVELAQKVCEIANLTYSPRHAAYDLRKLRGKGLITNGPRRPRYLATPTGLRTITALIVLRDKVLKPVLAGARGTRRGRPPKNVSQIDEHYRRLQRETHQLLEALRIAA